MTPCSAPTDSTNDFNKDRDALIRDIAEEYRMTGQFTGRDSMDPRVRDALAKVKRHLFVPEAERGYAYLNQPLPIGYRQTISQPYIVAIMTDMLDIGPGHVVLEIGTGSGYQAAILSELAARVYSIEVVPELAESAKTCLRDQGYDNVEVRSGDGSLGWPEHAPFDRIILTAAAPELPEALINQLAPGGRLIAPVGDALGQNLVLLEKDDDGNISQRTVLPVAFVPLTHRET